MTDKPEKLKTEQEKWIETKRNNVIKKIRKVRTKKVISDNSKEEDEKIDSLGVSINGDVKAFVLVS